MADFNFPGVDLSDPFLPPSSSISIYSPFKNNTPELAMKPLHDYGTFTYPLTPEDELPRPLSLPLRSRNICLNSTPSLSFSRSSSISSKTSSSSCTPDISSNRLSNTKWEPLTSFPYFTSLPLEIQRTIWRHTLPGPQIIEIYQYAPSTSQSSSCIPSSKQQEQEQEPLPILKTHTSSFPIALHINHLSRRLTLTHLSPLSFAQPYYLPSNPYVYINYHTDTIYLTSRTLYPDLGNHILYSRNLHKILYLALDFEVWSTLLGDNHFVNALLEMEGLVRIDIIFERDLSSFSSPHHTHSNDIYNNDNDTSTITSKPLSESINRKPNPHPHPQNPHHHHHHPQTKFLFLAPTKQETKTLENIFEKESEKIWLWGHVSGWEDIRGKLRFKFKQQDKIPKPDTRSAMRYRNGRLGSDMLFLGKNENEKNGNENELFFTSPYPYPYPSRGSRSGSGSGSGSGPKSRNSASRSRHESLNTKIEKSNTTSWSRKTATMQENLEEGLENLIHRVDDAMLDFEDVGREGGGGVGDRDACGWDVDGDREKDADRDVDVYVYSESEYSQCSGDLDDEFDNDCEVGGWI